MLSHSLLTPISAQQDEAPVAPGLCRVSFIHPAPTPSLFASFSLCSDKVIDGLSTLTMQAHFIVSAEQSFASSLVVLAPFTPVNTYFPPCTCSVCRGWKINLITSVVSLNCTSSAALLQRTCIFGQTFSELKIPCFATNYCTILVVDWAPCKLLKSLCGLIIDRP